ncbi:hypothetical protein BACUNI_04274 [Bacteroides uniformis ATCC 8492]|uniref:Uncharacterized protein n=1 Tax=Bacteroides uniformis (strain ATCC 8492 / DSM 6597 / CCUG 4942 / CIP 103695 / JCM 5828 / KCTC 5204 / NCTC 13054 / VPI 0061) TaxID=411479 RepID=A0ABC9N4V5_BACUC|nr:hypothetical protein BACUNI_04274 [Bacteroides uniformis ATCC 8492]
MIGKRKKCVYSVRRGVTREGCASSFCFCVERKLK